jgi:hypothetical protein
MESVIIDELLRLDGSRAHDRERVVNVLVIGLDWHRGRHPAVLAGDIPTSLEIVGLNLFEIVGPALATGEPAVFLLGRGKGPSLESSETSDHGSSAVLDDMSTKMLMMRIAGLNTLPLLQWISSG